MTLRIELKQIFQRNMGQNYFLSSNISFNIIFGSKIFLSFITLSQNLHFITKILTKYFAKTNSAIRKCDSNFRNHIHDIFYNTYGESYGIYFG